MRVLYIHAKGEIGGSDISLLTILKSIAKRFSPYAIVAKRGPLFEDYKKHCEKIKEVPFTVIKSPENMFDFIKMFVGFVPSIFMIWDFIRKWKIDIVHVNTAVVPSALIAAKLAGKPVVLHKREIIFRPFVGKLLDWFSALLADKIIVISNTVKHFSTDGVKRKSVVIYNGVDLAEISDKRNGTFRKSNSMGDDILLIGIFSRIEPWKGQEVVIKSMKNVASRSRNVRLFVFGTPYTKRGRAYLEHLKELVGNLGLKDTVMFPGVVKNVNKVYSDFDIVVLPSVEAEPLGRVVIEAMAARRAVIATNNGAAREIIDNGRNGLLVMPNNQSQMEDAITKLIRSSKLRSSIGARGRETVEKRFDIKSTIKLVENVYDELHE